MWQAPDPGHACEAQRKGPTAPPEAPARCPEKVRWRRVLPGASCPRRGGGGAQAAGRGHRDKHAVPRAPRAPEPQGCSVRNKTGRRAPGGWGLVFTQIPLQSETLREESVNFPGWAPVSFGKTCQVPRSMFLPLLPASLITTLQAGPASAGLAPVSARGRGESVCELREAEWVRLPTTGVCTRARECVCA